MCGKLWIMVKIVYFIGYYVQHKFHFLINALLSNYEVNKINWLSMCCGSIGFFVPVTA